MKILDSGHQYELRNLDGGDPQILTFVKREGEGYPGNVGSHPGTTSQEVLRSVVQRTEYVENQISDPLNQEALSLIKRAIYLFEVRAAKRHGREVSFSVDGAVYGKACNTCNHVGCMGNCH